MTSPRTPSSTNASAWHALREYLVDAYSNHEMRVLIELTLLGTARNLLPDERVSAQEYAATLCALIQRHSGGPVQEFWAQLVNDRPLRAPEIDKLRSIFKAAMIATGRALPTSRLGPQPRLRRPQLLGAALFTVLGGFTAYCAAVRPRPKIECRDGTISPTCEEPAPGCCSHHGGPREPE